MKKYYNKLVRDKIPAIIEESGKKANYKYCEDGDFYEMLLSEKIIEEAIELSEAISSKDLHSVIEELVDIRDVCSQIIDLLGIDWILIGAAEDKIKEKGGFSKRIFLESVEDIENERD